MTEDIQTSELQQVENDAHAALQDWLPGYVDRRSSGGLDYQYRVKHVRHTELGDVYRYESGWLSDVAHPSREYLVQVIVTELPNEEA